MKCTSAALVAACSVASLLWVTRAEAGGHTIRIDQGNGTTGCMSTWTPNGDAAGAAAFIPGGTYGSSVACSPIANTPADLFVSSAGLPPNDSFTATNGGAAYQATSGEMFQYFSGAPSTGGSSNVPTAQVAIWNLANSDTEIELNGWCPNGVTGGSFTWGSATYGGNGGCGASAVTDLLFNTATKAYVGYVDDSTNTIELKSLPAWTVSGSGGGTVSAPEIDASSAVAALTLLFGATAAMRGRKYVRNVGR
jgi:hypothetical protein